MTAQPRWYEDIPDILADESEFMVGLCEYNHILMERALGSICGECGGAGSVRRDTERDDIRLTSYVQCPACRGSGTRDTPAAEPVTDAALIDEWLDMQASREPAYNDQTEG